ncbi:MAG: glycosyltransferase [Oculatellaceae cyanobacterium Prado106]|nr:glycosyltransferase [Oculatellaceae cyanobacterium Prado106]
MSAYSCEPGRGSEPGVGWNIVREVARHHEVWVLTRPDESGDAIAAELARNPVPNLHFVYFTLPIWGGGWRWGQSGAMQIHYYLWQIQAYFVARRLHQQLGFDVVHHVTFVKYSTPSFLSLLPIPFVWGPVGGGESAPASFWQDFSLRAKVYEYARSLVRKVGELDPFVRITGRRSAIVRATTLDTAKRLYQLGIHPVEIAPESGLSNEDIVQLGQCPLPTAAPLRFISMGRLLHWKGFHLGIRAFAAAQLPEAEYWIVGDGPEQARLQALATELGVASQVKFWGRLPRAATLERLADCHVLVHPSLHDSGGWVCMEAMAAGRPVLCLNLGGPAVQITEQTGIKVDAIAPSQAVQDLAQAMIHLAQHPEQVQQMGQAGRQTVRQTFSWQVRGESLAKLYEERVGC